MLKSNLLPPCPLKHGLPTAERVGALNGPAIQDRFGRYSIDAPGISKLLAALRAGEHIGAWPSGLKNGELLGRFGLVPPSTMKKEAAEVWTKTRTERIALHTLILERCIWPEYNKGERRIEDRSSRCPRTLVNELCRQHKEHFFRAIDLSPAPIEEPFRTYYSRLEVLMRFAQHGLELSAPRDIRGDMRDGGGMLFRLGWGLFLSSVDPHFDLKPDERFAAVRNSFADIIVPPALLRLEAGQKMVDLPNAELFATDSIGLDPKMITLCRDDTGPRFRYSHLLMDSVESAVKRLIDPESKEICPHRRLSSPGNRAACPALLAKTTDGAPIIKKIFDEMLTLGNDRFLRRFER